MPNAFTKEEVVFFNELLEGFDANNVTAKNVEVYRPSMVSSERSSYTVWRPQPYISRTVDGLDVTGAFADKTQLSVPATVSTIKNVPFTLNAKELNDPLQRDRIVQSGIVALSSAVDQAIANNVALTGTLVATKATALSQYDDIAVCEALMIEQEVNIDTARNMILNARDYNSMSGNLANRETMAGKPTNAYERSRVGMVAGFDTFRAGFMPSITGAAGGATLVSGAGQKHVPAAMSTAVTGETSPVDNRYMELVVDNTVGVAAGDAFTIDGVYALSHIGKVNTGQLKTFRVIEVVDGTTLKISPAIIVDGGGTQAEDDYANVDAAPANLAALNWLNTTTAQANIFYNKASVEIVAGTLAVPEMDFGGVNVMRETTDSGIELIFARQGDINDLSAKYRLTMFFGTCNKNPEMNGILLGGQV